MRKSRVFAFGVYVIAAQTGRSGRQNPKSLNGMRGRIYEAETTTAMGRDDGGISDECSDGAHNAIGPADTTKSYSASVHMVE